MKTTNTRIRAYRGFIQLSGTTAVESVRVWYFARTIKEAMKMHRAHGMTSSDSLVWDRTVNSYPAGTVIIAKRHTCENSINTINNPAKVIPIHEFNATRTAHRLVAPNGTDKTMWAGYTSWVYMDGYVGITDYYKPGGSVITADEFCKYNAE